MLREALLAASRLAEAGISARVIDMHTIRPLDVDVVEQAARETGVIVTVEDHMVTNGLGSAVAECVAESGAACRLTRLGIPDVFSIIGPPPSSTTTTATTRPASSKQCALLGADGRCQTPTVVSDTG